MLSVLVFMCRDPGDATSKVSCCVETSYRFKNVDATVKLPVALENENMVNLKSASFIVIMLLNEDLTL